VAGSAGGFDAIANIASDSLREVLRRTMVLGMPEEETYRPTFYFDREVSWSRYDREGSPWSWTATPVSDVTKSPVQVLCAYEFFSPLGRQGAFNTEVGEFNPTTMVLTMFEDEFNEAYGFSSCTVGPSHQVWYFRFWKPAYSLGDMTVYEVQCTAEGKN
jgi:hypothetical protein